MIKRASPTLTRPAGFTLLEVVATIAVLSILAAAVLPNTVAYITRKNAESSAATLQSMALGIVNFKLVTGFYPKRLNTLVRPIIQPTDTSSCSGIAPATPFIPYNAAAVTGWNLATGGGPFFYRLSSVFGTNIEVGTVNDVLQRTAAQNGVGFIQITIPNVSTVDAYEINSIIDGTAEGNLANGSNNSTTIRYGIPVNNRVTLTYNLPIINGATGC